MKNKNNNKWEAILWYVIECWYTNRVQHKMYNYLYIFKTHLTPMDKPGYA